jgi:hypothetical protein
MRWESALSNQTTDAAPTVLNGVTYTKTSTSITAAFANPVGSGIQAYLAVEVYDGPGTTLLRRAVRTDGIGHAANATLGVTGLTPGTSYQCRVLIDDATAFTAL